MLRVYECFSDSLHSGQLALIPSGCVGMIAYPTNRIGMYKRTHPIPFLTQKKPGT
jgi:hypothetical protein